MAVVKVEVWLAGQAIGQKHTVLSDLKKESSSRAVRDEL